MGASFSKILVPFLTPYFFTMMVRHPDQRVAIFIDTQNMYYSARNLFNARVNFKNIVEDAVGDRRLVRAIAYVVRTKTGEERPFFDALGKAGIETKEKDLQTFIGGAKKADWDTGICIDAIKLADKVDAIVLISGDGDFHPLLEYLKVTKGCLVEVMSFKETMSSKLLEIADGYTNLSENARRYLMGDIDRNAERPPQRGPIKNRRKDTGIELPEAETEVADAPADHWTILHNGEDSDVTFPEDTPNDANV